MTWRRDRGAMVSVSRVAAGVSGFVLAVALAVSIAAAGFLLLEPLVERDRKMLKDLRRKLDARGW